MTPEGSADFSSFGSIYFVGFYVLRDSVRKQYIGRMDERRILHLDSSAAQVIGLAAFVVFVLVAISIDKFIHI